MNVILDENHDVRCIGCGALMRKLYWKKRIRLGFATEGSGYLFTQWYGCTDCGKYVYDKHSDSYLQSLHRTANRLPKEVNQSE